MTDEALRAMVANRLYSAPSADRTTDAVDDMVCYNCHYFVIIGLKSESFTAMK